MNDNEIAEMIKKAQTMINNNQVPPEIMQMANQINNNKPNTTQSNPIPNNSISNEDMSKILNAVKPYLNNNQIPIQPQSQPQSQSSSPLDQISNIARIAEIIKLLK